MSKQKVSLSQLAAQSRKKIDSPLAKYNSAGQLFCVLCNAQVKNEIYWTGHVNGKAHKENVTNLKKSTASTSAPPLQQQHTFKRPLPADSSAPQAPPKKLVRFEEDEGDVRSKAAVKAEEELKLMIAGSAPGSSKEVDGAVEEEESSSAVEKPVTTAASLPQGFFDDPKEDAKARGQKFRDPQDVEWDKFVKEIATEDIRSNEIVGVEQEKSAVERELDHIEEQMAQWQRVLDLEKKAIDYANQKKKQGEPLERMDVGDSHEDDDEGDGEEEDEYDEELDWRNKKR